LSFYLPLFRDERDAQGEGVLFQGINLSENLRLFSVNLTLHGSLEKEENPLNITPLSP